MTRSAKNKVPADLEDYCDNRLIEMTVTRWTATKRSRRTATKRPRRTATKRPRRTATTRAKRTITRARRTANKIKLIPL